MFFHFHRVEVIERELRHLRNTNDKLATEVSLFRFDVDCLVDLLGREYIVAHRDVVHKNTLQFVGLSTEDFIFLEGFKIVHVQVAHDWLLTMSVDRLLSFFEC